MSFGMRNVMRSMIFRALDSRDCMVAAMLLKEWCEEVYEEEAKEVLKEVFGSSIARKRSWQ